jgi:hypothetical protein
MLAVFVVFWREAMLGICSSVVEVAEKKGSRRGRRLRMDQIREGAGDDKEREQTCGGG